MLRRYQLCLFCFDRIKLECSNLCPGCRTEYGSEKDPYQKGEVKARGGSASASQTHHKTRSSPPQRQLPLAQQSSPHASLHTGRRRHSAAAAGTTLSGAGQTMAASSYLQQQQQESSPAVWSSLEAGTPSASQDGEDSLPEVLSRVQLVGSLPAKESSQSGPSGSCDWQQHAGHSLSSKGGLPWQGALQGGAERLGWGCWQRQKRRPAEAGPDLEVRLPSSLLRQLACCGRVAPWTQVQGLHAAGCCPSCCNTAGGS